jgi:hypothetical protein
VHKRGESYEKGEKNGEGREEPRDIKTQFL